MREEFFWALFGGGFIVFWAILITWTQQVRSNRRLRERELVHKERVLSLERGVALPEEESLSAAPPSLQGLALGLGFLLLFAGIGLSLAFYLIRDGGASRYWTFGLIPAMAGIGMLLYSRIGRRLPAGESA